MRLPPNLFVALHMDYSDVELGYDHVIMLGDTHTMRLFRGKGDTKEEAFNAALLEYHKEFPT